MAARRKLVSKKKVVVIKPTKKGQRPLKFRKGALKRALGLKENEKIPESKKRAALAGKYGPKVKRMAVFAFSGALAQGRKTAMKNRKKKAGKRK